MPDLPQPFGYAYRYASFPPAGATVIRYGTHGREINGSKPIEAIALYSADQVAKLLEQAKAPQ